jgi:hypothetical protein
MYYASSDYIVFVMKTNSVEFFERLTKKNIIFSKKRIVVT